MSIPVRSFKWILSSKSDMLELLVAVCSMLLAAVMIYSESSENIITVHEGYVEGYLFIAGVISLLRVLWPTRPPIIVALSTRGFLAFSFWVSLITINWNYSLLVVILLLVLLALSMTALLLERT